MVNGIILIHKPKGMSSNAVANKIKWLLKAKKAGHLGTLDVQGEGLLPVTLGKSTKLFDYFLKKDKVYEAIFRFGVETETLDLEGQITKKDDIVITESQINKILPKFIGKQNQMPPQYSAKKINGQKAYDLARKGRSADLKPKEIEIYDLQLIKHIEKNDFLFKIHCSSGTYIRSLARDIAKELSTYGIMPHIIRTRCGFLQLENAYSIQDVENGKFELIKPENLFDYDEIFLNEEECFKVKNGVWINKNVLDGKFKVFFNNEFIGIADVKDKVLKIEIRLI